ncbi:hypothetical protein RHSP_31539 [Rhizobium freirei PRF 81]|uniref:CopC domain-containing protein n=1 Tax=Rhizobium freirei PRF 81 TaxID=363754 RepID=N6V1D4_9HYPH|nr:copper homeostasis periplasmic binding protein CopC [Rhizobium freirei]ENN86841.1 hypothetical protein RHSP_31539 [Rhizobium freirei PRF 81]
MLSRSRTTAVTLVAILGMSSSAWAHAHLEIAEPGKDSAIPSSPTAITLNFSEGLEPSFSSISLTDESGVAVPLGPATVSDDTDTRLTAAPATPLKPGKYHVTWRALSKDGHRTAGSFDFSVMP